MPRNLLLADDSITIQKVVAITLAGEDFNVIAVDNGADALAKAREIKPDIVLADVVMPKKNGYELCEAIKSDIDLSDIPVLLLAGTFEAFDEARARTARADGHIAKPFESQALINKVKELLGRAPDLRAKPVVVRDDVFPAGTTSGKVTSAPAAPVGDAPAQKTPGSTDLDWAELGLESDEAVKSTALRQSLSETRAGSSGVSASRRPPPTEQALGAGPPQSPTSPHIPPAPGVSPRGTTSPPGKVPAASPQAASGSLSASALASSGSVLGGTNQDEGSSLAGPPFEPRPPGGQFLPSSNPIDLAELEVEDHESGPSPRIPSAAERSSVREEGAADPGGPAAEQRASAVIEPNQADMRSAGPLSRDGGEALLREALSRASREVIERIAWEVVPKLAEAIIQEHVEKLAKQRKP